MGEGFANKAKGLWAAVNHPVETVKNAFQPSNYLKTTGDLLTFGAISTYDNLKTVQKEGVKGAGKIVGGKAFDIATVVVTDGIAKGLNTKSGLGDLTKGEVKSIQKAVNAGERPVEIVGSAASGTRRGVGSSSPIGKGPGTRSDIDYVAPPSSIPYIPGVKLPSIDPKTGIIPGYANPFQSPIIRFEPNSKPTFTPLQH